MELCVLKCKTPKFVNDEMKGNFKLQTSLGKLVHFILSCTFEKNFYFKGFVCNTVSSLQKNNF